MRDVRVPYVSADGPTQGSDEATQGSNRPIYLWANLGCQWANPTMFGLWWGNWVLFGQFTALLDQLWGLWVTVHLSKCDIMQCQSNIVSPISCIFSPIMRVPHHTSSVLHCESNIIHCQSNIVSPTSCVVSPISCVVSPTIRVRHHALSVRP